MMETLNLSHKDQVALWAGRVVRTEAEIESMLRSIYHQLSGEGLSWAVVPESFAAVSTAVRKMLKVSGIDASYLDDCFVALDRLGEAHRMRNRVVHDQWVEQDPGKFLSASKGVTGATTKSEVVWDVADFERSFTELKFCWAQIAGLYWSLPCYIGDHQEFFRDTLPGNRETLAGRIRITGDNSWEYTDSEFAAQQRQRMENRSAEVQASVRAALGIRPDGTDAGG